MPLDEALPIATQIAEALEAAHEHGIIHRDLKPANVKVRPDGTVKVLDFGLAKALDPTRARRTAVQRRALADAHALATHRRGTILGTAAYMAPEQARGKAVDRRADIWAFGVVLYEMLTGRRAFAGDETSDVLAAVLRQEIDWTRVARRHATTAAAAARAMSRTEPEAAPARHRRGARRARRAGEGCEPQRRRAVPPAEVRRPVRARAARPLTVVSAVALLALGFALGRFAGWPAGPDPAASRRRSGCLRAPYLPVGPLRQRPLRS